MKFLWYAERIPQSLVIVGELIQLIPNLNLAQVTLRHLTNIWCCCSSSSCDPSAPVALAWPPAMGPSPAP